MRGRIAGIWEFKTRNERREPIGEMSHVWLANHTEMIAGSRVNVEIRGDLSPAMVELAQSLRRPEQIDSPPVRLEHAVSVFRRCIDQTNARRSMPLEGQLPSHRERHTPTTGVPAIRNGPVAVTDRIAST